MLILAGNSIKSLPISIKNIENIERLSISDNPIYDLPDFVYYLPNLDMLFIRHFKKKQISKSRFVSTRVTIFLHNQETVKKK